MKAHKVNVIPNFSSSARPALTGVALAAAALLAGCVSVDSHWPLPASIAKPKVPDHATAIWSDTVLYQAGQPGVRGFGGRVMFYGKGSQKPIEVDGTVTVYAFDNTDSESDKVTPKRKYVFTPEQLSAHYSKSKLGHSYSFWLPWDEVDRPARQISLILKFEGESGGMLMTDSTRVMLPGMPEEDSKLTSLAQHDKSRVSANGFAPIERARAVGHDGQESVVPATYEVAAPESSRLDPDAQPPQTENVRRTVTIDVPSDFARRHFMVPTEQHTLGQPTTAVPDHEVRETQSSDDLGNSRPRDALPIRSSRMSEDPQALGQSESRPTDSVMPVASDALTASKSLAASGTNRFVQRRFPAQREPIIRPFGGLVRRQPLRAMWPSALPPIPRSGPSSRTIPTPADASPAEN